MSQNLIELLRGERIVLEKKLNAIDTAIRALNGANGTPGRGRRTMSAEARMKISMAAKKRWAKIRRAKN
jgi:hypothetical protein